MKRVLKVSAGNVDLGPPAQLAQTDGDLSRNFMTKLNFLHIKGTYDPTILLVVKTESRMSKAIT